MNSARPQGLIAAGMENGQLALWDPSKIIGGDRFFILPYHQHSVLTSFFSSADSLVYRNSTHTGPVRGLDFNPLQNNLLSSGAVGGEVGTIAVTSHACSDDKFSRSTYGT